MSKKSNLPNVVVNATALDKSGALTILKQFVKYAADDRLNQYTCFIPEGLDFDHKENICFIEVPKMGWLQRIFWDGFKLKNHLRKNNIIPDKIISLQNTSINIDCEQIIYLHQPLPFSSVKWSIFKKEQFKFFLYKYFYEFFILLYVKDNTTFVVQTSWMKEALCSKWKIDTSKVHVIKPDIVLPTIEVNENIAVEGSGVHTLLYPATPLYYKNHKVILKALEILKCKDQLNHLKFQVTFKAEEYPSFTRHAAELGVEANIDYLGTIPYIDLIKKYQSSSIVLFPSYVETFGLPLAEAATLRKPVLCSDLPFSRDVLSGYPGAKYIDHQDPNAWADEIEKTINEIENDLFKANDFCFEQSSSWKDFFKLLIKS